MPLDDHDSMPLRAHWTPLLEREFSTTDGLTAHQITVGGSARNFFRIKGGGRSVILCEDNDRDQFFSYIRIAAYLKRRGIPLPRLIDYLWYPYLALLEDGGPESLQDLHGRGDALPAYRRALDVLVSFQRLKAQRCPQIWGRTFGYDDYRWETAYFRGNLLERFFGMSLSADGALDGEFERLARTLAGAPRHLMHRDFQSSNILVRGEELFIIDFQGARRGPLHYDLASLLKDPYVHLPPALHDELLDYYRTAAGRAGLLTPDFDERYALLSMQRLMQALGAYGYLGLVKGKERFLSYIPPALDLLRRTMARLDGFPRLSGLVESAAARAAP